MVYRIVGMNLSGGARRYCYILNAELYKRGIPVKTFIPKSPITDKYSDADSVPFLYINTNDWLYVAREIFKNRKEIHYVHLHLPNVCIRFFCFLKFLKIPYFITIHSPLYYETGIKTKIYRWLYKLSILNAMDVIFISDFVRANVMKGLGIERKNFGNIVHNGSEDPFGDRGGKYDSYLKLKNMDGYFKVCIVGELTKRKGLNDLEKILSILISKKNELSRKIIFNIYGEGVLESFIKQLKNKIGDEIIININGYVSDLSDIYKKNDLHMILSKDEAFGRVVTESMAFYMPTVCYNRGAFPEIIDNNINGILSNSEEELALSIIYLEKNSEVYKKMCFSAREKFLSNFESSIFVGNTLKVIDEALSNDV
jgi:glycosyltransferase involved in cell wall biosynthesis